MMEKPPHATTTMLQYGQEITDLAHELELEPEKALVVFGMFARKLVELTKAKGGDEQELLEWACGAFSRGLGITFAGLDRKH